MKIFSISDLHLECHSERSEESRSFGALMLAQDDECAALDLKNKKGE